MIRIFDYIWTIVEYLSSIEFEEARQLDGAPFIPPGLAIPLGVLATTLVILAIPIIIVIGSCIRCLFIK